MPFGSRIGPCPSSLDFNYYSRSPGFVSAGFVPENMVRANPTYLEPAGNRLYLDVLLRMVIEFLFMRYKFGWLVRSTRLDLPQTYGSSYRWGLKEDTPNATHFVWEDCEQWFPDTPVFRVRPNPIHRKMTMPPGTTIEGKTEYMGQGREKPYCRTLCFDNKFVSLELLMAFSQSQEGIGLPLRKLLGYSEEQSKQFFTSVFDVRLKARFEFLRSGHPGMPRIKEWVQDMFDELLTEFDARKQWERQKKYYT